MKSRDPEARKANKPHPSATPTASSLQPTASEQHLDLYWCNKCGHKQPASIAHTTIHGRPRCCGQPMDPDSPEETRIIAGLPPEPAPRPNVWAEIWAQLSELDHRIAQRLAIHQTDKEIAAAEICSEGAIGFHVRKIAAAFQLPNHDRNLVHYALDRAGVLAHDDWRADMARIVGEPIAD